MLKCFQIQITTLCISISLSAYVTLFCMFSPKLYIIVFQVRIMVNPPISDSNVYFSCSPRRMFAN